MALLPDEPPVVTSGRLLWEYLIIGSSRCFWVSLPPRWVGANSFLRSLLVLSHPCLFSGGATVHLLPYHPLLPNLCSTLPDDMLSAYLLCLLLFQSSCTLLNFTPLDIILRGLLCSAYHKAIINDESLQHLELLNVQSFIVYQGFHISVVAC